MTCCDEKHVPRLWLLWEDLLAERYTVHCATQGIAANATLAGTGAGGYWQAILQEGHRAIVTDGFACRHVVASAGPSSGGVVGFTAIPASQNKAEIREAQGCGSGSARSYVF